MRPSRVPGPWVRRAFRRLYQELSGRDHPEVLSADSAPTLVRRLAWIDDEVPPRHRRERRHQAHQEWYCARRYLLALAAAGHLRFPLTVRKRESPDFLLMGPEGGRIGLEITEATTPEYQRHLTMTEGDGKLHPLGPPDGWAADAPERALAAVAADCAARKFGRMARHRDWARADRHDLLLYNNGPLPPPDPGALLNRLQAALVPIYEAHAQAAWPQGGPGRVSLLTGGVVLYDVLGVAQALPVPADAV